MTNEFENFNDRDEEWLRELELRATDLENDLFDWREAHARELTDGSFGLDGTPQPVREGRPGMLRAQPRPAPPTMTPSRPLDHELDDAPPYALEEDELDDEPALVPTRLDPDPGVPTLGEHLGELGKVW